MTWLRRSALALFVPPVAYCFAALVGSLVPRNADWREPDDGLTIHVATNGYHTGLVLPVAAGENDWRDLVRPSDLADPTQAGQWLLFGWGDRQFYLQTPHWRDLKPRTLAVALFGSASSLVHVDHVDDPAEAVDIRAIRLRPEEYARLTAFVRQSFASPRGAAIAGYGPRDVFYPGRGRYSLVRTCNSWTADALAAAGVRVALWTPFSAGVMRWF